MLLMQEVIFMPCTCGVQFMQVWLLCAGVFLPSSNIMFRDLFSAEFYAGEAACVCFTAALLLMHQLHLLMYCACCQCRLAMRA